MNSYSHRFSASVYDELLIALEYRVAIESKNAAKVYIDEIEQAFDQVCLHPKMKQVVEPTFETNYAYRRVNVWRFAFLYRIDEERKELIIDRIYHERASA